jgi:hypothetical protein
MMITIIMGFYQWENPIQFKASPGKNYSTKMKKLDCTVGYGKKYGRWR